MIEKNRVCPECGGATNETKCEVCGRKTIPSLKSNEYLNDTRYQRHENSKEEKIQIEKPANENMQNTDMKSKSGHIQDMMNLNKKMSDESAEKTRKLGIYIAIAVVVFVIISVMASPSKDEYSYDDEYEHYDEIYNYYYDYLYEVDDDVELTCIVDKEDPKLLYVNNATRYFLDADVSGRSNNENEYNSLWMSSPYTEEIVYMSRDATSCKVSNVVFYEMDYGATDIPYELDTSEFDQYDVLVDQSLGEWDTIELMEHIYAVQAVNFQFYNSGYRLIIDGTHAYDITFDYSNDEIIFDEMPGFDEIDTIDMSI